MTEATLNMTRLHLGLLQAHPNRLFTEVAGHCGYDWLLFDMEHGLYSLADIELAVLALAATPTLAFVRLARDVGHLAGAILDLGVDGLVAPSMETAPQAQAFVKSTRYPPDGYRGAGASLHRISRYGLEGSSRTDTTLFAIIESRLGVQNVEATLAVEGVDGVMIGPGDLAYDLGCRGQLDNPDMVAAIEAIEAAARNTGKRLGAPPSVRPIEIMGGLGYSFALLDSEVGLLRKAMTQPLEDARRQTGAA